MGWLNSLSDSERWAYGLVATFVFAMLGIFITQRLPLRRAPQRGGDFPHVHYCDALRSIPGAGHLARRWGPGTSQIVSRASSGRRSIPAVHSAMALARF